MIKKLDLSRSNFYSFILRLWKPEYSRDAFQKEFKVTFSWGLIGFRTCREIVKDLFRSFRAASNVFKAVFLLI